jgi:hypothetical protein
MSEIKHYEGMRDSLQIEYSVIPAYLQAASSCQEYNQALKGVESEIVKSSDWVLLQEINVEAARYVARLIYKINADNQWRATEVGFNGVETFTQQLHLSASNQEVEECIKGIKITNMVDFSKSNIKDGTVAYVILFADGSFRHFAIYCPNQNDSSGEETNYDYLSGIIRKIKNLTKTGS